MNNDTQEWYHRGTTCFCTGRYAEAIEVFERALEGDLTPKRPCCTRGSVDRLGLFYEAVLCCDHALEVDDRFADAWFVKGLALFKCRSTRMLLGALKRL